MGSRLSPILADIFCHLMESEVISKHLDNNSIIMYARYVNDCALLIKKGTQNIILHDMNCFDLFSNFTVENIQDNLLPFLDTTIYLDSDNTLQLKFYKKPTASEVKGNLKHSVTPMKYKMSTLVGEIYRVVRCTLTDHDREEALKDLTELFIRNAYPKTLVLNKIKEVRKRTFQPSVHRLDQEKEKREHLERNFNLSIPYTSSRCEKITKKLLRSIKPSLQLTT